MTSKTHRKRPVARALAIGLAIAAIATPAALADRRSPDTVDAALSAQTASLDGRSPDTLDAVYGNSGSVPVDSWFQGAVEQGSVVSDGRSPDTLDAIGATQVQAPADGRSSDTRDAAYVAHQPVVTVSVTRFDWSDAAIGFGAAAGVALLALGMTWALRGNVRKGYSLPNVPA